MPENPIGLIVCDNILITRKIGAGSFAEIYQASKKEDLQEKYAVKFQKFGVKNTLLYSQTRIYKHLISKGGFRGLPQIFQFKTEKSFHILIMELLGPSIQDIFMTKNCRFSLKSALMVGYQMVERIRQIHRREIIHRDIKPDNFLIGTEQNSNVLYIVDFNLSKRYMKDGQHIPYKESKQLIGTPRYASINNHKGIEQSRRDDIQSIGYVILYLLRGSLPWQNLPEHRFKTKNQLILQKKIESSPQQLCRDYPKQLASFIQYARNLDFQQQPNYIYLLNLLAQAMYFRSIKIDFMFNQYQQKEEQKKYKHKQRISKNQLMRSSSLQINNNYTSKIKQNKKYHITPQKPKFQIQKIKSNRKISTLLPKYNQRLSLQINKDQNLRKDRNCLENQDNYLHDCNPNINTKQEINKKINQKTKEQQNTNINTNTSTNYNNIPKNINYKNQKQNNFKTYSNTKLVRERSISLNPQLSTNPTLFTNINLPNKTRHSEKIPKNNLKILMPLIIMQK